MLEKLNRKGFIIVVGMANSGTRIIPSALDKAGVYMGEPLNIAFDLLPEEHIYAACRQFGPHVKYLGKQSWDFSEVCKMDIPADFIGRLEQYLAPLIDSDQEMVGWKIPNNNFIYPWLTRLFPKASFVHWMRHPEGNCIKMTGSDRLEKWGVPGKKYHFHEWNYKMRAVSWKYHFDIVESTPRPENFYRVRFEDYVLKQDETRAQLGQFLGLELPEVAVKPGKAGPYGNKYYRKYRFIREAMDSLGYS